MSDAFIPPRPPLLPRKASLLDYMRIGLRSALHMFKEGSYETLTVGRINIPTFPFFKIRPFFIVRSAELVREVLVRRAAEFPKSTLMADMLELLIGHSIFTTNGEVWRRQRQLMDPAFEGARIKGIFPLMMGAVETSLARFETLAAAHPGEPVTADVELTHFAADVIFRTIFSKPMDAENSRRFFGAFETFQEIAYAHGMMRLARLPTRLFPSALRASRDARIIRKILKVPIEQRLAAIRAGQPVPTDDILASLIVARDDDGQGFSDKELLDQVSMLFLAGHETSATALAWALYLLAECPHLQDRLHDEAVSVLGDRAPRFSDMKKLAFARDVFREALRLYPPVGMVARDVTKPEQMGNKCVGMGEVVFLPIWLIQRHRHYWDHPDAFDPDRFETENGREGLRCAYLPFSMGPRVCAGAAFALQEATLLLAMMSRQFRVLPAPGPPPQPIARLTLRSANGIRVIVERR